MDRLFQKYQEPLLKLANNTFGRKFLGIDKEAKDKIVRLTPNSYSFLAGRNKLKTTFRCYPIFAKKLHYAINSLEAINDIPNFYKGLNQYAGLLNYAGLLRTREFPRILFTDTTVYASAGDGFCRKANATWATARGATDSDSADYTSAAENMGLNTAPTYSIDRIFYPFVTSSIGSGQEVSAATFNFDNNGLNADTDNQSMCLIQTTQASTTQLVTGDYDNLTLNSPAEGASRSDITGYGTGYVNMTLNAIGKGWINVAGNTLLGLRFSGDVDNSAPTGSNGFATSFSETAGTGSDPYLTVTHTTLAAGGIIWFL